MNERLKGKPIYKIIFLNQGKVYELYARHIYQGNLYGFIEVEELLFDERTTLLVDPTEERVKTEFSGVKRSFIPIHAVIRIDQVEKQGASKSYSSEGGSNISPFPTQPPPSKGRSSDD